MLTTDESILPAKTKELTMELGGSGTTKYAGFINEDYNPELTFPNCISVYDKMRKGDGTVAGVISACKGPILGAKWSFVPASEDEKDIQIAEFCERQFFEKLVWRDFLRHSLLMLDFGFMNFEKCYEVMGTELMYSKLAPRLPKSILRWQLKDGSAGITQYAMKDGMMQQLEIPAWKIFHLALHQEGDNYEGVSILRAAYKHWVYKENFYKIQAIGAERSGTGIPAAKFPEGKMPSEEEEADTILTLKNIRSSEEAYILEKGGVEFSFKTVGGGEFDFEPGINHHDRQIEKSALMQFLSIGIEKGGNAQNDSQQDLAFMSAQATAEYIAEAVQRELVREIVDLNFDGVEKYPTLTVSDIGRNKMEKLSQIIKTLADAGMLTADDTTENMIRGMMKLPEKSEEATPLPEPAGQKEEDGADASHDGHSHGTFLSKRSLTLAEDKVDWTKLQKFFDAHEKEVQKILETHSEVMKNRIADYLSGQIANGGSVTVPVTVLTQEIYAMQMEIEKAYMASYEFGKTEAIREMGKSGRIPTPEADKNFIKDHSYALAEKHAEDVKNEAVLNTQNAIRAGESAGAIAIAKKAMDARAVMQIENLVPILVTGGVNQGIGTVYENFQSEIWGWEYSAILDARTSPLCASLDGRVSKDAADLPKPPLHYRCRSRLVAILRSEVGKPAETGVPKEIKDLYKGKPWPYLQPKTAMPVSPDSPAAKITKK
ncbi:MAG: DUF935 family protein [Candidatus Peregrinibacteria bacterium]